MQARRKYMLSKLRWVCHDALQAIITPQASMPRRAYHMQGALMWATPRGRVGWGAGAGRYSAGGWHERGMNADWGALNQEGHGFTGGAKRRRAGCVVRAARGQLPTRSLPTLLALQSAGLGWRDDGSPPRGVCSMLLQRSEAGLLRALALALTLALGGLLGLLRALQARGRAV